MISVIVCSVRPELSRQLQRNIQETIGVENELLVRDNRKNGKGICAVYNELAAQASFEQLCFVHEDVIFKTESWGRKISGLLSGGWDVLGVAGAKYKSAYFSGWYTGQKAFDCAHVTHQYPGSTEKIWLQPGTEILEQVVCLDGVFICCRKKVWEEVRFDEQHLKGFHFYDVDFSLRAAYGHKVGVCLDIDLVHITGSGGDFGNVWVETAIAYHRRMKRSLPFTREKNLPADAELKIAKGHLDVLKRQDISVKNKMRWIKLQGLTRFPQLYYSILKFMLYQPLGLQHLHKLFKRK